MTGLFEAKPVFFLGIGSLRDFIEWNNIRILFRTTDRHF